MKISFVEQNMVSKKSAFSYIVGDLVVTTTVACYIILLSSIIISGRVGYRMDRHWTINVFFSRKKAQ